MRYLIEVTTGSSQFTGYVYYCFYDPEVSFKTKEEFMNYFLNPSSPYIKLYTQTKQINPLKGIDIALNSSVFEISIDSIRDLRVIAAYKMASATSVFVINKFQYEQLSDSTYITSFEHPADVGGFCNSILLSVDNKHTISSLEQIAVNIKSEPIDNWLGKKGESTWERITSNLQSKNILYFNICGP